MAFSRTGVVYIDGNADSSPASVDIPAGSTLAVISAVSYSTSGIAFTSLTLDGQSITTLKQEETGGAFTDYHFGYFTGFSTGSGKNLAWTTDNSPETGPAFAIAFYSDATVNASNAVQYSGVGTDVTVTSSGAVEVGIIVMSTVDTGKTASASGANETQVSVSSDLNDVQFAYGYANSIGASTTILAGGSDEGVHAIFALGATAWTYLGTNWIDASSQNSSDTVDIPVGANLGCVFLSGYNSGGYDISSCTVDGVSVTFDVDIGPSAGVHAAANFGTVTGFSPGPGKTVSWTQATSPAIGMVIGIAWFADAQIVDGTLTSEANPNSGTTRTLDVVPDGPDQGVFVFVSAITDEGDAPSVAPSAGASQTTLSTSTDWNSLQSAFGQEDSVTSSVTATVSFKDFEGAAVVFAIETFTAASGTVTASPANATITIEGFAPTVDTGTSAVYSIMVQRGTLAVDNAGTAISSISAVSSLTSAFEVNSNNRFSQAGRDDENTSTLAIDDLSGTIELTGVDELSFTRESGSLANDMRFAWEIVEYTGAGGGDDEFIVRSRNTFTFTNPGPATAQSLDNAPTDPDRCIPFITGVRSDGTGSSAQDNTPIVWINDSGQLECDCGGTGNTTIVKVVVVEFTGTNWTVLHGDGGETSGDSGTITLNTDSDGAGGSAGDVSDWASAMIVGHAKGDDSATNDALADNFPIFEPGSGTTTVDWRYNSNHDGSDNRHFVHVLKHADMVVTRFTDTQSLTGAMDVDISSAGLTDITKAMVLCTRTTSGTGTAYGRGWVNVRLTSTSNAELWTHRSGNTVETNIQVVDFAGLYSTATATSTTSTASPATELLVFDGSTPTLYAQLTKTRVPSSAAILFEGSTPVAVDQIEKTRSPGTATVLFNGQSLTTDVVLGQAKSASPGTELLVFKGKTPTTVIKRRVTASIGTEVVTFSGSSPKASNEKTRIPGTATILFSGSRPKTSEEKILSPTVELITFVGHAPSIIVEITKSVSPQTATVVFVGGTPTTILPQPIGTATILFSGSAPSTVIRNKIFVTPATVSINFYATTPSTRVQLQDWVTLGEDVENWTTQTAQASTWTDQSATASSWMTQTAQASTWTDQSATDSTWTAITTIWDST